MREMILKLIEARARLWEKAKAHLDAAVDDEGETRELTAEETATWETMNADLGVFDARIAELEQVDARDKKFDEIRTGYEGLVDDKPLAVGLADQQAEQEKQVRGFLAGERASVELSFAGLTTVRTDYGGVLETRINGIPAREAMREFRDLTVATATAGGNTVPTEFVRKLYEYVIESSRIFQTRATVLTTDGGEAMTFPAADTGFTATLEGEGDAIAESDGTTAVMTLDAYKHAVLVQISSELTTDTGVDLLDWVARDAGRAVGDDFGEDAVVGDGSSKAQGVMPAGTATTGATGLVGVPTADELINLVYGTKEKYATNAEWLMRRATVGKVRKITDDNNQYLWQPGLQANTPSMLLEAPIVQDPFVAATGLNALSLAYGDFSAFYIRRVNGLRFERSDSYAFANDLITFRAIMRADSDLIDANAIQVYKGGAS